MSNIPTSGIKITLDQTYYLAAATSDLGTRIGAAINLLLQNALNSPVGATIQSALTETQFQAVRGVGWILADGRSVAGSSYQTITGSSTIPDLRDGYLRGKNNSRSDGKENPDGELALGARQSYAFASHGHTTTISGNVASSTGTDTAGGIGTNYRPTQTGRTLSINVDSTTSLVTPTVTNKGYTQVKSIVVNCFIRIN